MIEVDRPERDVAEAHQPTSAFGLLGAGGLADERRRDEGDVSAPFDLAVLAHASNGGVRAVMRLGKALGHFARRDVVDACGRALAEGFVRALLVVVADGRRVEFTRSTYRSDTYDLVAVLTLPPAARPRAERGLR